MILPNSADKFNQMRLQMQRRQPNQWWALPKDNGLLTINIIILEVIWSIKSVYGTLLHESNRKRRKRDRWTIAIKKKSYICFHCLCPRTAMRWFKRRNHIERLSLTQTGKHRAHRIIRLSTQHKNFKTMPCDAVYVTSTSHSKHSIFHSIDDSNRSWNVT